MIYHASQPEDRSTNRNLPKGWALAELVELAELINGDRGKNYPSKNARVQSGIPFINAGHLNQGNIDFAEMDFISKERFDLLSNGKVAEGDILYW